MGYKRKPKLYRLKFEDEEYAGFECVCRPLSVEGFIEVTSLSTRLSNDNATDEDITRLFEILSENIASWNLEDDDDHPIPVTIDSLKKQDFDFIMAIQMAWMSGMVEVPSPLPSSSNNGGSAQEAIVLSLENLSRNLPS